MSQMLASQHTVTQPRWQTPLPEKLTTQTFPLNRMTSEAWPAAWRKTSIRNRHQFQKRDLARLYQWCRPTTKILSCGSTLIVRALEYNHRLGTGVTTWADRQVCGTVGDCNPKVLKMRATVSDETLDYRRSRPSRNHSPEATLHDMFIKAITRRKT